MSTDNEADASSFFAFQLFAPGRTLTFRISFIVVMTVFVGWKLLQIIQYTADRIQVMRRRQKRLARSSWALAMSKEGKKAADPPKKGIYQHRVAFLHPDLGIGGAERLIVDAVAGLQELIPTPDYLERTSTLSTGVQQTETTDEEGIVTTPDPLVCSPRSSTKTSSPSSLVLPALFDVHVFTNHHDPKRCFEETVDGTFRNPIRVLGSWIPRHIRNKGHVLFASLRMTYAAIVLCFRYQLFMDKAFDCIVIDQAAAAMPIFKLLAPSVPLFFYCHFPDQLCDPSRMPSMSAATSVSGQLIPTITCVPHKNPLKRFYRAVFDVIEGLSMDCADRIACNSLFSRGVTVQVFPHIECRVSKTRDILYPPINLSTLLAENVGGSSKAARSDVACDDYLENLSEKKLMDRFLLTAPTTTASQESSGGTTKTPKFCAISLNRYEKKKNIALAIRAFGAYIREVRCSPAFNANDFSLVIAGGYDPRLPENVNHYAELIKLVEDEFGDALRCAEEMKEGAVSGGDDRVEVLFLRSCTAEAKKLLLTYASAVMYTPSGEHFGIVPVEAMAFGAPVIAISNGGPLESVGLGDEFGLLRSGDPSEFKEALVLLWGKEGTLAIQRTDTDVQSNGKEVAAAAARRLHLTTTGQRVSKQGALRAAETFSLDVFATKMGNAIDYLCDSKEK